MLNILSLFDGISVAYQALKELIPEKEIKYYASEIDKFAIQISKKNHPNIIHIGNITKISPDMFKEKISLIVGGFPCQDLSIAGKKAGLKGERSGLFYTMLDLVCKLKPDYFIFENVASMPKKFRDEISKEIGCEPIMFDASLVSAQHRKRLFWTNIKFELPEDRGIYLKDILEPDSITDKIKNYCLTATYSRACPRDYFEKHSRQLIKIGYFGKGGTGERVYSPEGKSVCLCAQGGGMGAKTGLYETKEGYFRKLTPVECERLQSLPDDYTQGISDTQRYKCLGNAFNKEVIKHIIKEII